MHFHQHLNLHIQCVDIWSSDIWSRIGGNASQRDQSHVNTRHEVLDWFEPSRGVIALHPVLMYYAIKIVSSLFLSGSFRGLSGCPPQDFQDVFDVDLSSLFIVENRFIEFSWILTLTLKDRNS
jgi:hypothetical protein